MEVPKRERLNEFFRRLLAAPNAGTAEEAVMQLAHVLDAVEDELAGIPNVPENWETDRGSIHPSRTPRARCRGIPS